MTSKREAIATVSILKQEHILNSLYMKNTWGLDLVETKAVRGFKDCS